MSLFAYLTAGAFLMPLLTLGWNGSVARAADAASSCHCERPPERQTKRQNEIHSQKQRRAFDASNEQLLYQMAQTDGAGLAEVPAPSWLEKQQTKQSEQQAGQAENC
jgi:hypothetical protein